jgi:peptide/nickel transport system ATP-binding protein
MPTLLDVRNLKKYFRNPAGMLHAVDDVSFTLDYGQTVGVVGESGCGKTTLGRTILHLIDITGGQIFFEGKDITNPTKQEQRALNEEMQLIFQDPYSSLNPRMSVSETISEPLLIQKKLSPAEVRAEVRRLMDTVGLADRFRNSYPHELDGGRRQRIGVARALALKPKFIVCDEPVSALDVSIQAQIINLMLDLQDELKLAYMFVTHDLSVVKYISNDIIVMYLGQMAEKAPSDELFEKPMHPYTKALLSAILVPEEGVVMERVQLHGELSSPIEPPDECRFAKRCLYYAQECDKGTPPLIEVEPDHFVACHRVKRGRMTIDR